MKSTLYSYVSSVLLFLKLNCAVLELLQSSLVTKQTGTTLIFYTLYSWYFLNEMVCLNRSWISLMCSFNFGPLFSSQLSWKCQVPVCWSQDRHQTTPTSLQHVRRKLKSAKSKFKNCTFKNIFSYMPGDPLVQRSSKMP